MGVGVDVKAGIYASHLFVEDYTDSTSTGTFLRFSINFILNLVTQLMPSNQLFRCNFPNSCLKVAISTMSNNKLSILCKQVRHISTLQDQSYFSVGNPNYNYTLIVGI